MDSVSISWLVASAISPLVTVLALWTIYVFHTYRRRWRTVDIFLLALTSTELTTSVLTFCFSILNLIHRGPAFHLPCLVVRWGQVSARTFQVALLASMAVDRALTVRWPYRYRFSVRRNQIRYHIAVLAMVAALVGVAAVFANVGDKVDSARSSKPSSEKIWDFPQDDADTWPSTNDTEMPLQDAKYRDSPSRNAPETTQQPIESASKKTRWLLNYESSRCNQHPSHWDPRFTVFLLSLYGGLLVLWIFCTVQVEIHRSRPHVKLAPECVSPDLPTNSPLDTQSSTGSTRALHRPSRQASRRPYGKDGKSTSDLRWPSVAFATLLCFTINHVPYGVLTGLAAWHPRLWSSWHDPGLAWLGLLEGLALPLLLFCRDAALGAALRRAFQRRSGALSPLVGDDGPFQMYFDKDHFRKRGTFGSVTPIGIITNYRRTPGGQQKGGRHPRGGKYSLPGLHGADSVIPPKKSSFLGGHQGEPLSKLSCADLTSLGMWREEEEEFYATLSDDFSTFSCKSGDDSALSEDLRDEEVYGGSFTTVANDDFEFHDTRPCGGEVRMKPALLSPDTPLPPPSRNPSFRENIRPKVSIPKVFPESPRRELFVDLTEEEERKDPQLFILPPADDPEDQNQEPSTSTSPMDTSPQHPTPQKNKSTSLSMNDLDLIHQGHPDDLETTFILPVKSESTMSLYRLNVDQDSDPALLTPSRSETNVNNNGDSGFGSGAQSTNPVWSGFLCRKPSDPFWNIRKPSSSTVVVTATSPSKNSSSAGVMHPRMRKIPWISAWKKLDENSRQQVANEPSSPIENDGDVLGWKDNLVYEANGASGANSCSIDEELSEVNMPVTIPAAFNGDYNLNDFTQESGILIENAFGKIVRDDSGVQVNFYSKNMQYDQGNTKGPNNCFENRVEPRQIDRDQNGDYSNCRQLLVCDGGVSEPSNKADKNVLNENVFCGAASVENQFKCEPRLNGGHYENLFGTKENIFARYDPYLEKGNSKVAIPEYHFDKRCDKDKDYMFGPGKIINVESSYGQLNKPEKCSKSKNVGRSPSKNKELRRRESDNRGNRCGIKRRESRTRSDPRPNLILETNARRSFTEFETKFGEKFGSDKPSVEIEMKNVRSEHHPPESRLPKLMDPSRNFNAEYKRPRPDGHKQNVPQTAESNVKVERRDSRSKKVGVERNPSARKVPTEFKDVLPQNSALVERRTSQLGNCRKESGLPVRVERRNSDKLPKTPSKTNPENRNEGLWVNAIPFPGKIEDDLNGNSPKKESRRDKPANRSPRKSNLPRRESSDRNRVKRKVSGNRDKRPVVEDPPGRVWGLRNHPPATDDFSNHASSNQNNFVECERRLDQIVFCGKLNGPESRKQNGEAYPFETFQENGGRGQHLPTTRPVHDNDNYREKKLPIIDFL